MNLKTATPEQLEDSYLPDEVFTALAEGKEWEYTPDSIEGADADVDYCDDCGTYHLTWTVYGLRLDADGTLYETLTLVDTDGDWTGIDESPYGEIDHRKNYADARNRWRRYTEYVARTGIDPVGEFSGGTRVPKNTTYVVHFAASIVGPRVVRVRRAKGGTYAPLADQPQAVRAFFADLESFTSMDDLRERAHGLTWLPGALHRATFTVFTQSEGLSKAELRRRARTALLA